MSRRRILFLNTVGVIGGQEMVLLDMVRGLDRHRFEPVVATMLPGPVPEMVRAEGTPSYVLPPHRLRRPLTLGRSLAALARIVSRERIELIHCNGDSLLFYGAIAGAPWRRPCVWHVYEPVVTGGNLYERFFYQTQRRLRAAWTIFGTAAVEESYLQHYPELGPHTAIMPGVDVDGLLRDADAGRARRRFDLPHDAPVFLVIGRLQRSKGHRYAIEALASLVEQTPRPHLVVCGGPPIDTEEDHPEELRTLARSLGVRERVHFVGLASEQEKRDLLAAATAVVHPAVREAFGIAVIEGMAAAKPVVVTDCVGPQSIVRGSDAAEEVPRANVPALASAMARLLADPERAQRRGAAGQAHVRARYDKRAMVARVEDIYEQVLTGSARQ
jgi:glycosyltransferase involved in cell wall biosynthesis